MKSLISFTTIFLILVSFFSYACEPMSTNQSSEEMSADLQAILKTFNEFKASPNETTAEKYFATLPNSYGDFYTLYGNPDNDGGELEGVMLGLELEELEKYLPAKDLAKKYVQLAVGARYEADNVGSLQSAYQNMLKNHPELVVKNLAKLSESDRRMAIAFLFDGYYPDQHKLEDEKMAEICQIDQKVCEQMKTVYSILVDYMNLYKI